MGSHYGGMESEPVLLLPGGVIMAAVLMRSAGIGRKLWLLTGGALAAWLAIGPLAIFVPSVQRYLPLVFIIVSGIWAALALLVLLADARRQQKLVVSIALALAVTLSFSTHWFGIVAFVLGYFGLILFIGTVLVFAALRLFRKKTGLARLNAPPDDDPDGRLWNFAVRVVIETCSTDSRTSDEHR